MEIVWNTWGRVVYIVDNREKMAKQTVQEKYLPEFIYGSIDGLVTTFAIVTGVVGAALSPAIILVLGFANVLADGFSMGASNYLSQKSENKLGDSTKHPIRAGLVTFISFVCIGSISLIPFLFAYSIGISDQQAFYYSSALTLVLFAVIGWIEGTISKTNRFKSAFQTIAVGALAAAISYVVGWFVGGLTS